MRPDFRASLLAIAAAAALAGAAARAATDPSSATPQAPLVTVTKVAQTPFVATVEMTGSLVARHEVFVTPRIGGLAVTAVGAQVGDKVTKGETLVTLDHSALDAQVAQSDAGIAKANAAIAQAMTQVPSAEANDKSAAAALARAQALKATGNATQAALDSATAAAAAAHAAALSAEKAVTLARADLAGLEAQRRQLDVNLADTQVKSPVDGVVSRRTVEVGYVASTTGEPPFRVIEDGDVEFEGQVYQGDMIRLAQGQPAVVALPGGKTVKGRVRLLPGEVDKTTRLGAVRVALDPDPALKIGAFARATVETARVRGLGVPETAVLDDSGATRVEEVVDGRVKVRDVKTGLRFGGMVQILSGVADGATVIARAGPFLNDGDAVRAAPAEAAAGGSVQ
ncbi:MAG: efflux RND transporter periplasmic adaptor subunit [Hyphomicrobiales bacterium]|nr:efflux RND transporter periplasmic adaptor subunit [Hyphomicrobiales bacterium]MDE2016267.1 efflux RND transporter periplasmic adaptor subunit [Hyphomicrobiales bacterium]